MIVQQKPHTASPKNTIAPHGAPPPLLVNSKTAAKMLAISPRKLWALGVSGELTRVKIGGRVLFSIEALKKFIAKHEA